MGAIKELQAIMQKMAKRLEADWNDEEARAIFDRSAELLETLAREELRCGIESNSGSSEGTIGC